MMYFEVQVSPKVDELQRSPPKDRREGLVRRPKGAHSKNPVGKFFFNFPLRDRRSGEAPEGHPIEYIPTPKADAAKVRSITKGRTQ
jgi:hypothetical protein